MQGFLGQIKEHTFKYVATAVVGGIIGSFIVMVKVPHEVDRIREDLADVRSEQVAMMVRINYQEKSIQRLSEENLRDSLAQKYIIEALQDIKEGVKAQSLKFDQFIDGYYHRVR